MSDSSRIVVVTGGSKGIGRAVALRFAVEEAHIVLIHYDPDEEDAARTVREIESLGAAAESLRLDVSSFKDVEEAFSGIVKSHGGIDVLVNNAGITRDTLVMRMNEQDWDAVLAVNLKSVFNCTHAVLRTMARQRSGRIVNISSVVAQIGNAGQANYSASKSGILGFSKSVAKEMAGRGITVNAVAPGYIDTEMTSGLPEKVKEEFLSRIPLRRIGRPEDVAEAVYWLSTDAAGYITGQVIHV
ncbi:MAG TPA: 3-oxoacyl-[acyl-carrier-protein] reductase, partial [Desulfobacteraceae bacterium]|nr:3-oxoacyl-[acyl-carrier-protein] reductase [Desulfobacteraceae bacterium]